MIIDANYSGNRLVEKIPQLTKVITKLKNEVKQHEIDKLKIQADLFDTVSISGSLIPFFDDIMTSAKHLTGKDDLIKQENNLMRQIFSKSHKIATEIEDDSDIISKNLRIMIYDLITLSEGLISFLENDIKPLLVQKNTNITADENKIKITVQENQSEESKSNLTYQHKQNYLMMHVVELGNQKDGIYTKTITLDTENRTDYHIKFSFWISGRGKHNVREGIRFYLLDEHAFGKWQLDLLKNWNAIPSDSLYNSGLTIEDDYMIGFKPDQKGHLHVILDNRKAEKYLQHIPLTIIENWKEHIPKTSIVTTLPTEDESLKLQIERLIDNSNKSLKIISPYIDSTFLTKMVQKKNQGVKIEIITREEEQLKEYAKKELSLIKKEFSKNVVEHSNIHSRIIIKDEEEILISSADMNKSSLHNQPNLGVIIKDPNMAKYAALFFKKIFNWKERAVKKSLFGDAAKFYEDIK